MNLALAPKYTSPINKETFLVWFNTSNKYLLLNTDLKTLIDLYLDSENQETFLTNTNNLMGLSKTVAQTYFNEITTLLVECNKKEALKDIFHRPYIKTDTKLITNYLIDDCFINIQYSSKKIMHFLHNQIQHLTTNNHPKDFALCIDIQEDDTYFYLYANHTFIDRYLKKNYHLLQGAFNLELLNSIYQSKENDWLAMLHGSAISNNKEALIFVGHSGNGKSTFTSLMVANGYTLVSDDITPVHASKTFICSTPSGISIKEGAFNVLNTYAHNFKSSEAFIYSTKKGNTKYISASQVFKKHQLPCHNIILIKYQKNAKTRLTKILPKNALEVLIPDSWTSPIDKNAKMLMAWYKQLNYYELCYSNSDEAIKKISTLFN